MKILLNNREEFLELGLNPSIEDVIDYKNYKFKMLVVRLNGELIKKEYYASTVVAEGDDLKIIHLVSGG